MRVVALVSGIILVGWMIMTVFYHPPFFEPARQLPVRPVPTPPGAADLLLVKKVIDGDTILLSDDSYVRYIGIDTPETKDPRKPVQCFGLEAAVKNRALVEGRYVRLVRDVSNIDAFELSISDKPNRSVVGRPKWTPSTFCSRQRLCRLGV